MPSAVVNSLDAHALAMEHLELCDYKIAGYWDDSDSPVETLRDRFYEEIVLPRPLAPELASSAIVFRGNKRQIQLKFALKAKPDGATIGELMLIYNENMEFVDENWQLDLNSPSIVALSN
ncbi:MAG: hypothetical protein F6J93_04670 [Oscillatoria sp. SIO1A7]|nr:hypothetical protein [Oscillatoria sp. SIO1A7]